MRVRWRMVRAFLFDSFRAAFHLDPVYEIRVIRGHCPGCNCKPD